MRAVGYCTIVNDSVRCKTEQHESLTSKSYVLTYLLTPWSRGLLEKLTGSQLVKKFPVYYGTRGYAVAQLVEALSYNPEGRGFDSRWRHWILSLT